MSTYANRQLVASGPNLRDPQHAARAFVDGDFALAPKLKFQHHVVISTLGGANAQLSLLAKTVELPKFQVTTEVANQYNKKNVIMTGITYQPITIKLYDDNSGVARALFEKYYSYTFSDHGAAKAGLYGKSLMQPFTSYGLENSPIIPFVNYIKIHTFAKRRWLGFELVNPTIVSWSHDTFNWTDTAPAEYTMSIAYDAVKYDSGNAAAGSPPNFGGAGYDQTPSPLQTPGGGTSPANGTGGVRTGSDQVFGTTARRTDPSGSFQNPLATSSMANNTTKQYNNLQPLTLQGISNSTNNSIVSSSSRTALQSGRIGLNDTAFPVYDKDQTTLATTRKIVR